MASIRSNVGQAFPGEDGLADLAVSGAAALHVDVNPSSDAPSIPAGNNAASNTLPDLSTSFVKAKKPR